MKKNHLELHINLLQMNVMIWKTVHKYFESIMSNVMSKMIISCEEEK